MLFLKAVYFYLFIFIQVLLIKASQDEYRLMKHLFTHYDKKVRPIKNHSESLDVRIALVLNQIIEVNEKEQFLISSCWINEWWTDHYLSWNESEFGGIDVIIVPQDIIWHPDIILYNNAERMYKQTIFTSNVNIHSNGTIFFESSAVLKSTCDISVTHFPFDEQSCFLKFSSWTYFYNQVNLSILNKGIYVSNYVPSSEWDLVGTFSERRVKVYISPFCEIFFTIVLRRRALFYVFNLILPCTLITFIALLSFYMPADSGEKITLGISTMLSMTVFLTYVSEKMPPSADLPLIGLYYGIMIFLVTLATSLSVVTVNIHHRGDKGQKVPEKLRRIVFGILSKVIFLSHEESSNKKEIFIDHWKMEADRTGINFHPKNEPKFSSTFNENRHKSNVENLERQVRQCLLKIYQTINENNKRIQKQERLDAIRMEWQQVALVFDRILLVLFTLAMFGATIGILFMSPHGNLFTI